jgi:hypothetical protein
VKIALWIAAGVLGALLLCALLPWLLLRDLRRSGKGREFLIIILALVILLAVVVSKLLSPATPA